jgi:hypothetical protein
MEGIMRMRMAATALGVIGGLLAVIAAVAALLASGADTVVVGSWATVGAAIVGIAGGISARRRPGRGALLMAVAAVIAGFVAPGVIPAIADDVIVFLGYLAAGPFLLGGTAIAFAARRAATGQAVGHAG